MTGDIERGAYGRTRKVRDWGKYNPMGLKFTPFPQEQVCAFCESKADVIFPVNPKLCGACVAKVAGRTDVMRRMTKRMDLAGYRCDRCGRTTFFPVVVNTRICHPCTAKMAQKTAHNQYLQRIGARQVF